MSSCPLRLLSCPSWISSCPLRLPFWHLSWSSWFPPLWYRLPSALSLNCPLHCRLPCRFFLLVSRRLRWRSLLSFSSWISSCPLRLLSCPSWISRPFRLPFWHLLVFPVSLSGVSPSFCFFESSPALSAFSVFF